MKDSLPTKQRVREHFANFVDANLDDMFEDFLGIELDGEVYSDDHVDKVERFYIDTARGLVDELRRGMVND